MKIAYDHIYDQCLTARTPGRIKLLIVSMRAVLGLGGKFPCFICLLGLSIGREEARPFQAIGYTQ